MDIFLHGTNRGMVEVQFMSHTAITYGGMPAPAAPDYIQLELLGRTNCAYRWAGEADVLEAVAAAKRSYTIDENRVLLRGFSMGGSGTWHLGLHHPDHWAAIEPIPARSTDRSKTSTISARNSGKAASRSSRRDSTSP
jgi:dienelactone hydrolase